jgi:tetratricopeptide (TPR) repeat protein
LLGLQRERELAQGWISARQQACRHSYEHAQDPPVASCQADVAGSDHYVLILAARYGTRQSDHGHKSVTELEFEAALAAGCTLHAFFLNFSSDLANAIDDDAGRARLDAFKQRVQRHCRAQLCRSEAEFSDAIKLLAAAPPPRPADSPADPTLPQRDTPHNLPFRNQSGDGLVGREQALAQLEALLGDGGGPVLITGMDGVGKTALALHHLRRRMDHYRAGIVLLDGQLQLTGVVEQLALFLQAQFELSPPEELPPAARLAWLYSHWPGQGAALLFVDELERQEDLRALAQGLPQRLQLLATCRRQLGETRRRVPLSPLQHAEAAALLEQLAEREPFTADERRAAQAIAREVGGLPLALQLLGRQLAADPDLELHDLADRLRQRGGLAPELQGAELDLQAERGLQAGFALVWADLSEAERELARLVGAMPEAPLPWELLAPCRPQAMAPEAWEKARLGLVEQHLLERVAKGMLRAHPLLHDLFAQQARCQAAADRAVRLGAALAPWLVGWSEVLEARGRERCERCLPLLEALAAGPECWPGLPPGLAPLALGRVRSALGAYPLAQLALEAALPQLQDERRAACLVALAGIARERGQLPQAEAQCRQALELLAAAEGSALERAEALNGLGLVLHACREQEAEPVLREALALRLAQLGNHHRLVQLSRNNLGRWLAQQHRFAEAERLYNEALAVLAEEPCEVAVALHNNRGSLALAQGDSTAALAELKQAEQLAALVLGERSPQRGLLLFNLAVLTEQEGDPRTALAHYALALELVREAWGSEHPRCREFQLVLEAAQADVSGVISRDTGNLDGQP